MFLAIAWFRPPSGALVPRRGKTWCLLGYIQISLVYSGILFFEEAPFPMGEKNKNKRKKGNTIKTARALARLGCKNPYARTWIVMLP